MTEYDLHRQNGVSYRLKDLTNIELFFSEKMFEDKKEYKYKLFTRESIFFSRRCELYHNISRQQVYELMTNMLEQMHTLAEFELFKIGMIYLIS